MNLSVDNVPVFTDRQRALVFLFLTLRASQKQTAALIRGQSNTGTEFITFHVRLMYDITFNFEGFFVVAQGCLPSPVPLHLKSDITNNTQPCTFGNRIYRNAFLSFFMEATGLLCSNVYLTAY